jgi:hypothetical protein
MKWFLVVISHDNAWPADQLLRLAVWMRQSLRSIRSLLTGQSLEI